MPSVHKVGFGCGRDLSQSYAHKGSRMTTTLAPQTPSDFIDRRQNPAPGGGGPERRQFGNTHYGLSPAARELAEAIDSYKLQHRRRYVTFEEMLQVITELGYSKQA
jgi:hypothetical protein